MGVHRELNSSPVSIPCVGSVVLVWVGQVLMKSGSGCVQSPDPAVGSPEAPPTGTPSPPAAASAAATPHKHFHVGKRSHESSLFV